MELFINLEFRDLRIGHFCRVYSGLRSPSGSFKLYHVIPALKIFPSSVANAPSELRIAFMALRSETTAFLWPHLLSCPTFNSNPGAPPSLLFLNTLSTSMLQGSRSCASRSGHFAGNGPWLAPGGLPRREPPWRAYGSAV